MTEFGKCFENPYYASRNSRFSNTHRLLSSKRSMRGLVSEVILIALHLDLELRIVVIDVMDFQFFHIPYWLLNYCFEF